MAAKASIHGERADELLLSSPARLWTSEEGEGGLQCSGGCRVKLSPRACPVPLLLLLLLGYFYFAAMQLLALQSPASHLSRPNICVLELDSRVVR